MRSIFGALASFVSTVALLVLLVQALQMSGDRLVARYTRR